MEGVPNESARKLWKERDRRRREIEHKAKHPQPNMDAWLVRMREANEKKGKKMEPPPQH